jgi:hypothetical protein
MVTKKRPLKEGESKTFQREKERYCSIERVYGHTCIVDQREGRGDKDSYIVDVYIDKVVGDTYIVDTYI